MILLSRLRRPVLSRLGWSLSAKQAVVLMVGLGLLLRLVHLLRVPSVWHDEAALIINVIFIDFRQMLGPLLEHEAAPPLFLMAEHVVTLILGDSISVLRLLPFLASCASVVLVAMLAWKVLPREAAPWAVGLFAVSDRLLWHAIEAKPYAIDVFLAVAVAYYHVTTTHWSLAKRCLVALPVFPVVLWLSFPSCFILGGWFIAQVPVLLRSRSVRDWLTAIVLASAVTASFFVLLLGPIHAQRDSSMEACWTNGFPNWQRPWSVPYWSVMSTFEILSYCLKPLGGFLIGVFAIGVVSLWRKNERTLLAVLFIPMDLAFLAALLGKYPYCGMRVLIYMAPAICLLFGAGIPPIFAWLRSRSFSHWWVAAFGLILAFPFAQAIGRIAYPWPRADTKAATQFVMENWQSGDQIGFNGWESQYDFRKLKEHWYEPHLRQGAVPTRLWFVAISADPRDHDLHRRMVHGNWTMQEERSYKFVRVGLFLPEKPTP
ncbi:MAG: hypothetical protein K8T89_25085 [Planctomycetes bacterium]|nr:hypothetical protein [Planctomycetota bacterium]